RHQPRGLRIEPARRCAARHPRSSASREVVMTNALCCLSAPELAALIRRKKVSPVEVVDAILTRIEKINPKINAYVTLDADAARRGAKAAERSLGRKGARLGPLHGVPFSVKDLVITKGLRTTFGTPLYRDNVPTEDAPMVERLKAAGGIMLGKTNTPTFGWLGVTHNLLFGATRNPWALDRSPGGSSGGASAAAAAGLGPLHIGTDGGGSIRIPASFAGIFGFKASWGRIPTYPASGTWNLSHIGPMTRTVADAALMLAVSSGPDERDPGLLPLVEKFLRQPPTQYVQAWFDRLAWWQHPRAFFEQHDLLLTPTVACPPLPIGVDTITEIAGRPVSFYGWIPFTYPFNLTGQPAASVPAGFTKSGLPVGLQIVGRRLDDATVLRASAAFERARPWGDRRAPIR